MILSAFLTGLSSEVKMGQNNLSKGASWSDAPVNFSTRKRWLACFKYQVGSLKLEGKSQVRNFVFSLEGWCWFNISKGVKRRCMSLRFDGIKAREEERGVGQDPMHLFPFTSFPLYWFIFEAEELSIFWVQKMARAPWFYFCYRF